jgi:peptide/nickel transport system substrate-binding protein
MVGTASQVAVLAAVLIAGCESPARVKPWRHAPDPISEAKLAKEASAPGGLDAVGEREAQQARAHTLRVHVDAEPGRLTPLLAPTQWARRITLGTIFEPLVRYVPPDAPSGTAGRYAPRLARSWRVSPSGLEVRVELEPGVMFHDGHPLSAADVQFTLDAIRDPRRGIDHLRPMLDDVEAVELIAPLDLRLRLKRPSGWVLRALAEIPILPMHIYDGSLAAGGALVGTGPWRLASHKAGVVRLTRFDRYWGEKPAIADVEFVYEPDAAAALREAKRGNLDIVPSLIPAHWPEPANAPGIVARFRPLELAPPRLRTLIFNTQHAPLDDPRVRQALALLVDRRTIAKRVFDGLARPAQWPIWPGGLISGDEPAVPDFDPAAASKLLEAAGWIDSEPKDGIRDRAGRQLRLLMIGGEKPAPKDAAGPPLKLERDYFIAAAHRLGVLIDVRSGGEAWLDKRLADGHYDIAELMWSGMVDADVAPRVAHASPRIDRALDALAAVWDPAERAKLAPELAAAFVETWPFAGIVADAPHGLVAKRLHGVRVWDGWIDFTQLRFE